MKPSLIIGRSRRHLNNRLFHSALAGVLALVCTAMPLAAQTPTGRAGQTPPAAPTPATAKLPEQLTFDTLTIKDPGTGLDAYTMLYPDGWHASGKVLWDISRTVAPSDILATASNADASQEFNRYPSQLFVWSAADARFVGVGRKVQGCTVQQPPDGPIAAIERVVIPSVRPNLRGAFTIIGAEELPKLAAAIAPMYNQPGQGQQSVKAARVRIEYTKDQKPWREEFRCVFLEAQGPGGIVWGIDQINAFRAPRGLLDSDLPPMDFMALSLRPTLRFTDALDKLTNMLIQNFNTTENAIMERVRIQEQAQQQISNMITTGYQQRQKTMDAVAEQFDSKVVRGVQDRTNPFDNSIEQTPDEYDYSWVTSGGQHIYTNDSSFNPNENSNLDWRQEKAAN